jgi:hypothetical protein
MVKVSQTTLAWSGKAKDMPRFSELAAVRIIWGKK